MAAVPSPCTRICILGGDGICRGCSRTLAEIAEWGTADEERRRRIAAAAAERGRSYPRCRSSTI